MLAINKPIVTVVLPVYNAELYLHASIQSILKQTFREFELLIVDDGSTDTSWNIISSFTDPRISKKQYKYNKGIVHVLNHAFDNAKTKYIARMDADDIAFPNRLEEQVKFLEEHPEYGVCGSSVIYMLGPVSKYIRFPEKHDEILASLFLFEKNVCHPTVVLRRDVLVKKQIKYNKEYLHAEDYDLWVELSKHTKLYNIQIPLLQHRKHDEQISSKYYSLQMDTTEKVVINQLTTIINNIDASMMPYMIRLLVLRNDIVLDDMPKGAIKEAYEYLMNTVPKYSSILYSDYGKMLTYKYLKASAHYSIGMSECLIAYIQAFKNSPVSIVLFIRYKIYYSIYDVLKYFTKRLSKTFTL